MACLPYPTFLDARTSTSNGGISMSAVGRVRVHPSRCPGSSGLVVDDVDIGATTTMAAPSYAAVEEYRAIVAKLADSAVASSSSNGEDRSSSSAAAAAFTSGGGVGVGGDDVGEFEVEIARAKKGLIKEGTAMASSYLRGTLGIDVSIIDVEIVIDADDAINTDGLIASSFLDAGCAYVVIMANGVQLDDDHGVDAALSRAPMASDRGLSMALSACDATRVPRERLVLHCDTTLDGGGTFWGTMLARLDEVVDRVGTISVRSEGADLIRSSSSMTLPVMIPRLIARLKVVVQLDARVSSSIDELTSAVISLSKIIGENGGSITLIDPTCEQLGACYAACMNTDRPDGLFPTVVCTRNNEALGLVYSSKESIIEALRTGRGVYHSRSRNGLWRKGDTSGHHQTLHRIDADCDADALRFTVTQNGDGDTRAFCHLNTLTCWGEPRGIRHLEGTLVSRLRHAPAGSYTKRLFDDNTLLRNKLVEEAQELSEATTREHVAEELADVLYFAMVRAVAAGVSIDDAVAELDRRARKMTRRQGDSKAYRIKAGEEILAKKG
ncbi:hypothetical protein ACHAXA_007562 [Cyclostephanos tholiformis]|uniref:Phosphoribosyl-AMP cyclohydrolase domain-containing protein n=1 Tax=Cyclostephanos tholiformis TaxID=382380 RepID=A0ABD3SRK2_9STRA